MKWNRIGRIFNPEENGLMYAKSPQAIVHDDYVRIYFSDCKRDGNKLISYVCYADFSKNFQRLLDLKRQIISDGEIGCFDEHGIFPFSPFQYKNQIVAYTSGWSRRVSVSVDTAIGLVRSKDGGKTFYREGKGPVLTSTVNEPFLVVDGFVREFQNLFHMWYIYGKEWKVYDTSTGPERIYKIGHAISKDGIEWKKDGLQLIDDRIVDECQALPTVVCYNNEYHMFFCWRYASDFRSNPDRGYRLGYARSKDLVHWIRMDEKLNFDRSSQGWDSEMLCYPNVFTMDDKIYMLYNGNQFGRTGFGIAVLEEME